MNKLNEQEQLNELELWWSEYGRSIIIGVVLAVVTVGGWNFWHQYKNQRAEQASDIYYQMMNVYDELENSFNQNPNSEQDSRAKNERMVKQSAFQEAANNLKTQYAKTEYAQYARLQSAKYHVLQNDLASAEKELREILANSPSKEVDLLTRTRLARVLLANGQLEEALKVSMVKNTGSYEAVFLEIQGDVYFAQGDSKKAFEAYRQARDKTEQPSEALDLKYFDLLGQ